MIANSLGLGHQNYPGQPTNIIRQTVGADAPDAGDLTGGSALDIVLNRWVYNLRWNPVLKQWVQPQYENVTQLPAAAGNVNINGKQYNWVIIIGGVAVVGALAYYLIKRRGRK